MNPFFKQPPIVRVEAKVIDPKIDHVATARVRKALDHLDQFTAFVYFRTADPNFVPRIKAHSRVKNLDYLQRLLLPSGLRIITAQPDAVGRPWWSCLWAVIEHGHAYPPARDLVNIFGKVYNRYFLKFSTWGLDTKGRNKLWRRFREHMHALCPSAEVELDSFGFCTIVLPEKFYCDMLFTTLRDLTKSFPICHVRTLGGLEVFFGSRPDIVRNEPHWAVYLNRSRYAPRVLTLFGSCYRNPLFNHLTEY